MEFEWAYFFSLLSFYLSMLVPVLFLFSLFFFLSFFRARKREKRRGKAYENDWPCRKSDTHRAHCYCYFRYWNRLFLSILFYFIPQHFCLLVCSRSVHRSLRIINVWRSHIYIYIYIVSYYFSYPIVSGFSIHFGQKYRIFKHVVVVVSLSEAID